MTRNRTVMLVSLITGLFLLAACDSSSSSPDARTSEPNTHSSGSAPSSRHAAEPATAPATSAAPAGDVVRVGAQPEGIVYDRRSNLVAVAVHDPDRLLLLDPTSLAVRRSVPLPGSARHLQVAQTGNTVLVPAETANELVQVAVPSGRKIVTRVLKQPHDAAGTANGDVAVGDEFGRALSIIRGGKVIKTFRDLQQPGGVIADGNLVTVVDVRAYTVTTYDLSNLREIARIPAGEGPTHGVLASGHRVVVADTRGNQLLVYSDNPLRRIGRLSLPGTPYGTAIDSSTDTMWVTLTGRNEVVGVDVRGNTPKVIARYPTVQQPNTVAVAPGSHELWITGTDAGVVQRITR